MAIEQLNHIRAKAPDKKAQLVTVALLIMIGATIIAWFSLTLIRETMSEQIVNILKNNVEDAEAALNLWEERKIHDALILSSNPELIEHTEHLLQAYKNHAELVNHTEQTLVRELFHHYSYHKFYDGFFIIAPDYTNLASTRDSNIALTNLLAEQDGFLASVFSGNTHISLPVITDVPLMKQGKLQANAATMFVAAPITNKQGETIAVLSLRIDHTSEFGNVATQSHLGTSVETYFFDGHGKMLTESRFKDDLLRLGLIDHAQASSFGLEIKVPDSAQPSPGTHPLTLMASAATNSKSGHNMQGYINYRGAEVVGAWTWSQHWNMGIVSEVSVSRAFEAYGHMKNLVLTIVIVMVVMFIFLYAWTSSIYLSHEAQLLAVSTELERLSFVDGLTGISNRRFFDEVFEREWVRAKRDHVNLSIILVDIDYFKQFNDTYGHQLGDECLKLVASILRRTSKRATDFVARYGGEEFAILLPETNKTDAWHIAEACRKEVRKANMPHSNSAAAPIVTISLGTATLTPKADEDANMLIELSDKALYEAKKQGRDYTCQL